MKLISAFRFPLSAFIFGALGVLAVQATPVLFTVQSLTGTAANRTILIQPDRVDNPLVLGTNLVPVGDFTIQPVGGQVTTNLLPWGYTIRVDGWPRSAHITVPESTNTINVVTLINTNAFSPITINYPSTTNVDNATGTNVVLIEATFEPSRTSPNYSRVFSYGIYNDFYGNTNYPEAQDLTNSYGRIAYYVNGESYLAATNTTGRTPKYAVTRFELLGGTLFKLASDLTANGNDFAWIGGDLVVVRDVRVTGIIYGNGSGVTNLQPSNIVGGWTGIVTNWGTGMGVNSNRQYFSFGIVTNVTRP